MNNGKTINEIQNEEVSLQLLAAQSRLYTKAKGLRRWQALCAVVPALALTLLQVFQVVNVDIVTFSLVEVLVMCAILIFPPIVDDRRSRAARVQQAFDSRVYGLAFCGGEIQDIPVTRLAKEHDAAKSQRDLKNWYSVVNDDMTPGEAVSACQRMNCNWSRSLLLRYTLFSVGIPLLLFVALMAIIICTGADPASIVFLGTLLEWVVCQIGECVRSLWICNNLCEKTDPRLDLTSTQNVLVIQSLLYEKRRSGVLVPDWLYEKCKDYDELQWS